MKKKLIYKKCAIRNILYLVGHSLLTGFRFSVYKWKENNFVNLPQWTIFFIRLNVDVAENWFFENKLKLIAGFIFNI